MSLRETALLVSEPALVTETSARSWRGQLTLVTTMGGGTTVAIPPIPPDYVEDGEGGLVVDGDTGEILLAE